MKKAGHPKVPGPIHLDPFRDRLLPGYPAM